MSTQSTTPNPPLTSGETLTAILLALCPSAMGRALAAIADQPNVTLADWSAAVKDVEDTTEATSEMQGLLNDVRYAPLFTSFLHNDSVNGTPVNAAVMVQNKILSFFNTASSTPGSPLDWGGLPPHPHGADVTTLINYLNQLPQTSRVAVATS